MTAERAWTTRKLPRMTAGMREVAARAGVSIATVSNVLNRPHLVSEPTRDRVREAIGELGFVRNGSARQLRRGTSEVVTLVLPHLSNPFFTELARGVEERALQQGWTLLVCWLETEDAAEKAHYLNVLMEQRVRGILLTRATDLQPTTQIVGGRVPVILTDLDDQSGAHCTSSVDDVHGGELAVRHLHELGHQTIAWVGSVGAPQITARANGVRNMAHELRMEVVEVTTVPRILTGPGRLAADELHERGMPSAVICANDMLALGMELRLLGLGYEIPGDVSIIGFDDIEFAAAAMVPLTSVARPAFAMGSSAIDHLIAGCGAEGHEHQQVVFNAELSVRSSTGPARADSWSGPSGPRHS